MTNKDNEKREIRRFEMIMEADRIVEQLVAGEGEITPLLEKRLEALNANTAHRLQTYQDVCDGLNSKAERFREEVKRLQAAIKRLQDNEAVVKRSAIEILEARARAMGWGPGAKCKLDNGTIYLTKRKRNKYDDQEIIDSHFGTDLVEVTYKVDKHAVIERLKAGKKVRGVTSEEYVTVGFRS